jgi:hypothetical protein
MFEKNSDLQIRDLLADRIGEGMFGKASFIYFEQTAINTKPTT